MIRHTPLEIAALVLFASCSAYAVTFVDPSATGAGDGSSWGDAFTELQAGLASAGPSGEVWVAGGVYTPAGPGGDRTATFSLLNGQQVYGGFLGTETNRNQRDSATNITTLSGDLNGDDVAPWSNMGDNSYHVVTASGLTAPTPLDGFAVTRGWAWQATGSHSAGAGIYVIASLLTIADCRVEGHLVGSTAGRESPDHSSQLRARLADARPGRAAARSRGIPRGSGDRPDLCGCGWRGQHPRHRG